MLHPEAPALVLAPMDGITDAPMRQLQGETGAFSYAVTEFIRVSIGVIPAKVFRREVPELATGARTASGLPVQVQILGGDPDLMAKTAVIACRAGAPGIDINFGCPAPTVNRNDGGASLLRHPHRIRAIVAAVRAAVPAEIPVSAKLRLGWESIEDIHVNAAMAAEGGASWLTIHARTRMQSYAPPVYWPHIGKVRKALGLPIIANGDIWTVDDFKRCQDETGCRHFMIGRAALANPALPHQIALELGIGGDAKAAAGPIDWDTVFRGFVRQVDHPDLGGKARALARLKQWIKLAYKHGDFPYFDAMKQAATLDEFFDILAHQQGRTLEPVTGSSG